MNWEVNEECEITKWEEEKEVEREGPKKKEKEKWETARQIKKRSTDKKHLAEDGRKNKNDGRQIEQKSEIKNVIERDRETEGSTKSYSNKSRSTFARTDAVLVKVPKERTYAEVFKDIANKTGDKLNNIKKIRKSMAGDLVIELTKEGKSEELREAINAAVGEDTGVRTLQTTVDVMIKNLDPIIEKEDFMNAFISKFKNIKERDIRLKTLRSTFDGTKTAVLEISAKYTNEILRLNKIKIGYVYVYVRIIPKIRQCYRCHEFGHIRYQCKMQLEDDNVCRRCGKYGHAITSCSNETNCILCERRQIHEYKRKHVAGSVKCPQFKALNNVNRYRNGE